MPALVWWSAAILWAAFILVETWTPRPPVPAPETSDWVLHGFAFAVLGVFLRLAAACTWPANALSATMAIGAGLGGIDELGQIPVPGRSAAVTDLAADVVGLALGAVLAGWTIRAAGGRKHRSHTAQEERKMAEIKNVGLEDFDAEVINSPIPVLVDFWAPWCGPCHMVAPIVEKIAERYAGKIKVVKVNLDEALELAQRFGIQSIPTLMVFKNGEIVARLIGVQPEQALASAVESALD